MRAPDREQATADALADRMPGHTPAPIPFADCPACDGQGVLIHVSEPDSFGNRDGDEHDCRACDGTGVLDESHAEAA